MIPIYYVKFITVIPYSHEPLVFQRQENTNSNCDSADLL